MNPAEAEGSDQSIGMTALHFHPEWVHWACAEEAVGAAESFGGDEPMHLDLLLMYKTHVLQAALCAVMEVKPQHRSVKRRKTAQCKPLHQKLQHKGPHCTSGAAPAPKTR
eukprot:RCo033130